MNKFLLYLISIVSLVFIFVSWILPLILSWIFEKKFQISVRIGRIAFPYLKLCNIQIIKNGFHIHIEEIGIKSSFLNSDLTKLVTLVVKDVRINKDIGEEDEATLTKEKKMYKPLDFRDKQVPKLINTFVQFTAVHIYSISAMLLRVRDPGCLIHSSASELHIDGNIFKNAKSLLLTLNLMDASAKVLRHAEKDNKETCLAEFGFGISLETILVAQGPLSVEKLDVKVLKTSVQIKDGFYNLGSSSNNRIATRKVQNDELFERIFPIIPKNCSIRIDDTSLKGIRENCQVEYSSSLKSVILTYKTIKPEEENSEEGPIIFAFYLNNLQLQNNREKLLILNSLKIDAKLKKYVINLYLHLNTLLITYVHTVIYRWIYENFLKAYHTNSSRNLTQPQHISQSNFERMLKKLTINICAEFCHVSALFQLNKRNSSIGFKHLRLMLDQAQERRTDGSYISRLPNLILDSRHWQIEVLLESFWWSFKENGHEFNNPKVTHVWGTPAYVGMCLFKLKTTEGSSEIKIGSLVDTVQLEWSLELADYILVAIRCMKQYNLPKPRETKQIGKSPDFSAFSLNLAASHFNFFFQSQNSEYFVFRLNLLKYDRNSISNIVQFEEFKIFNLINAGDYYSCMRTEDISNFKAFVKMINMEFGRDSNQFYLESEDEVIFYWSTNLHLKAFLLYKDITEFLESLKEELALDFEDSNADYKTAMKFILKGCFCFNIEISDKHSAKLSFFDTEIDTDNILGLSLLVDTILLAIDNSDIFTISGFKMCGLQDHPLVRQERLDAENLHLPWNDTWNISLDLFKAVFPYNHNYAEAVQNQLLSVIKWLKILHNLKKGPFEEGRMLPRDLIINVNEFLFEMSDDPFEVKLRDNFELLVDEYNESLKRQKVLKEKVAQLCKIYLHLPAGTVDDLFSKLKQKNAEIYIQRSKQMQQTAARTRLFAWNMTKLEIIVLADPSMYGLNNVINMMREIDSDAPWPEEGIEFSTLWCRIVSLRCREWKFQLRDFPQPLMDIRQFFINGTLIGAEQQAPRRAVRTVKVELGEPFEPFYVERGMLPMKFYHDFNCEVKSYRYAFGPCWEPVIAMCNLCFEKIIPPSRDPSPPLPFWDKMRLFLHGRLTMVVDQLTVLLHASLDPYNTTEEMELTWNNLIMDWTNAKFIYKGDLNIFVRTASKYDDCQLLHLPNLKLILGIKWNCLSDPNDHHNVVQCAPDKIPEYSSNQVHDSFRAFRSQNVSLSIVLETRPPTPQHPSVSFDNPTLVLYGSTLRWIENLKLILSGVTRPTKRGRIFANVRPRKIQLSRHYKKVHLIVGLHKFQVCYWLSYAMQRGCEMLGDRLSSTSEHVLSLVPVDDGLKHRPKAEWSILYMTSYLNDSEIWLKSALHDDTDAEKVAVTPQQPVEKCFCLSVAKVSYGREAVVPTLDFNDRNKDTPTHRLVVYDLKGAWTKSNRNVALALYDTFMKSRQLKKNLSTDLLKIFRKDNNSTPLKRRNTSECPGTPPNASSLQGLQASTSVQDGTPGSQGTKLQMGHAANMLQQLIAEAENNSVVYSDDLSATRQQHLQGLQACQEDDVQYKNWQISLVNAQVLLKGCETKGYVILSAAKADILQRIHRPAWKDRTLVTKTTWTGLLECMQYYATVNAGENDCFNENIMWLTINNIQEKESTQISEPSEVPNMVGSGVSVGAVVSDTVGPTNSSQLQRIVSRCKCEFFYANYGDISVDPENLCEVPPPPQDEVDPWNKSQGAVDAFTLMHHDLEVCTNSLQYAMLLDIVNNLLLYVEPHRKEALEKLARMRFQLQLHSVEDQRKPIQNQQTVVRTTISKLRRLEKNSYLISKALAENPDDMELLNELNALLKEVDDCKNQLNAESEELDMMLSCFKEGQLLANSRLATTRSDKPVTVVRSNEICFKHAQWRLTEADGLIGIADLVLSNFLYTKKSNSDDSVVHLLELGYLRMTNLLPNEIYKEVICPTEIQFEMPIEHKKVLRIFCREKPPVGGISVKEHFEINLVPLKIELTKKFYNTMMKFCFPERDTEHPEYSDRMSDDGELESKGHKKTKGNKKNRDSNFYVPIDDVEIMKERAEKNKLFVYIKIPEVPIRLSYKGSKEKNLEDLRDISLVIPTLEYHNMTWTWLDLLMAIRNDSKSISVVSQAIKQKLIKRKTGSSEESSSPQEEDKARMLFGERHAPENKSIRKGVGGVFKFGKGT
ncbi:protein KIAA0100 isoform X2 [Coccinella septempunctata]|uniref:protein KIAA0100 isoform X2 n=1 Tax=Coccinella septempunctata TaxID=41139 RepID=UPI001D084FCA|nr:protein KIAA0100 isoform X2 [Coccinella septempunctata]